MLRPLAGLAWSLGSSWSLARAECPSPVGDPHLSSFALCCQAQKPASTEKSHACDGAWDCEGLLQCQLQEVAQAPDVLTERQAPGVAEMRVYFDHLMGIYLTGEIPDPVFLDIEHVIPSIFLAMAASMPTASPDLQVLDVGAFAGAVSCASVALWDAIVGTASKWPGGPGTAPSANIRVLAVEPSQQRCNLLNAGGSLEAPKEMPDLCKHEPWSAGRISAVCVAASSANGEATLQCPQEMSFLAEQVPDQGWAHCSAATTVRTMTLDTLTAERGITKVDLLKIDAEGHDYEVLRGASGLLRSHKIRFVIFEVIVHPELLKSYTSAMMHFMEEVSYDCFIIAPEMLVPVKGPWLSKLYISTSHAFNALCAHKREPLMQEIILLYSRVPRATQFSLAAIGADAFRQDRFSDAALRRQAVAAEHYFQAMYDRAILDGWSQLPHLQYMRARLLQAAGQVAPAIPIYEVLQREPCCREPSTFQAQREYYKLKGDTARMYIREVLPFVENRSRGMSSDGGGMLHELVWYHRRPGSGAAFDQVHACQAKNWLRPLAMVGEPLAALEMGLLEEFGLCEGKMSRQGLAEATVWYRRALKHDRAGMTLGRWGMEAHQLLDIATNALREEQRAK